MRGQVSTLIVPQDYKWTDCDDRKISVPQFSFDAVDKLSINRPAALFKTHREALLFLSGKALRKRGLQAAARIMAATGCDVLSERLFAHMERGAGIPSVDRLKYFPEHAVAALSNITVGRVGRGQGNQDALFRYKDMPSRFLAPPTSKLCASTARIRT